MTGFLQPLIDRLAGDVTGLIFLLKIVRADGVTVGLTDHHSPVTVAGVTYAPSGGFAATAVKRDSGGEIDNLEIGGPLGAGSFQSADVIAGLYDNAEATLYYADYNDSSGTASVITSASLGRLDVAGLGYQAELRGIQQKLQRQVGRVFAPGCDAVLGDARCGKNLASFTFTASVSTVTNKKNFTATALTQAAGYFTGGLVTWTSGLNVGTKQEVKFFNSGAVELFLSAPYVISGGDTFTIVAGCDKTSKTCKEKFANLVNFRGFPDVPTKEKLTEVQ